MAIVPARPGASTMWKEERVSDPIGEVLGEVPLPPYVSVEDVGFAVRAVVVHAAVDGPAGVVCRCDGWAYPCRLHRWGRRVLAARGLAPAEVDELVRRGDPAAGPVRVVGGVR
jgi:hypothetical protein